LPARAKAEHTPVNSTADDKHGPGIRLHPPIIYAISILTGIGLNNFWPLLMPYDLHNRSYGITLIVIALLLAAWSLYQFYKGDTDVRPDKPDSSLLTSGPYRFTRNPLYIVLTLVQLTAAIWLNNLWIALHAIPSVIVITRYAIAREERYLEALFGQQYADYKKRVRRWL
jgi:protein-S-isoprenylcysteine O-methyltransferase Ste14